jgi:hypothetical protein
MHMEERNTNSGLQQNLYEAAQLAEAHGFKRDYKK